MAGGEPKIVTATYVIPKTGAAGARRPEKYYGYWVRVYYHNALQTEDARPKSLLGYDGTAGAGR